MTVAELIEELEKLDPDTRVFVNGHPDGGGLDEVDEVQTTTHAGAPLWVKNNGYYCSYAGDFTVVPEDTDGACPAVRLW